MSASSLHSRRIEQEADDATPNDPQLLKGAIQSLQFAKENEMSFKDMQSLCNTLDLSKARTALMYAQHGLCSTIWSTHPATEKRIAKFQKRIDSLESEQPENC